MTQPRIRGIIEVTLAHTLAYLHFGMIHIPEHDKQVELTYGCGFQHVHSHVHYHHLHAHLLLQ
jgi:hypothetical protein